MTSTSPNQYRLVVKNDLGLINIVDLENRPASIGRARQCDIVLDHEGISRIHASLEPHPEGWRLVDRQSTNGVFINGQAAREAVLAPGDVIEIRPFVIDFLKCEPREDSDIQMTVTSATLLSAIKDPQDITAWNRFTARYRPMILSFARKLGLNESDADDIVQETLLAFIQGFAENRYSREKGRLRSWLFGIAQHKVADFKRKLGREVVIADRTDQTGFLGRIESPDGMEKLWDEEWQNAILKACLTEIAGEFKPQTLAAFELYVLKGWPVEKVAEHLKISENSVYIAKNRVLSRIQKIKGQMEDLWDKSDA